MDKGRVDAVTQITIGLAVKARIGTREWREPILHAIDVIDRGAVDSSSPSGRDGLNLFFDHLSVNLHRMSRAHGRGESCLHLKRARCLDD